MDTLSYKTISANKETSNKEWVLVNAEDMILGRLASQVASILRGKHTGYPGGQKRISPKELFDKDQTSLVKQAIKGMLPKNKLGRTIYSNLFVYVGTDHKQEAQQPKEIKLKS